MLFVITAIDKENALELRMATRAAHFDYVSSTGVVRLGGPFLDADGGMVGSLVIIEVEDFLAAKAWQTNDPYAKAGLFAHAEVRPWKATANFCKAEL
ncbi:MAG TPA: YciI family protein [Rhizomicrobium sp.]|jgi:hypothetical protein